MSCCIRAKKEDDDMYGWYTEESFGKLTTMEERWKIMYNEQHRSPTYSVSHYITYLRRYVAETGHLKTPEKSGDMLQRALSTGKLDTREAIKNDSRRSQDFIRPMSYFIRKLKLDLKMAFPSFIEEFVQPPNNGLRLLIGLLKNLQVLSSNPIGSVQRSTPKGTLRMEEYKKNMIDEQDCLLCIKFTLRIQKAVEEILDHTNGLFTVTTCLLSNFLKSRITVLEILTLILTGPSSVDKVLDAFTSMRIKYAESSRFKMLINMLHTRGVSHVLFQVSCLRLLNTLLNLCKTANMRVFLQYEMEEAGLDWERIQEGAHGDGLEYDDLRKEIREWKMRYIDVDVLLRKIKADLKGNAAVEYSYDQHYGPMYGTPLNDIGGIRGQSHHIQYKWGQYVEENGHLYPHHVSHGPSVYISTQASNENIARNNRIPELHQPKSADRSHMFFYGEEKHSASNVISTTPSKGGLPHTKSMAVHDTLEDSAGNRISITSEICEPYGLIIRKKTHNDSNDSNPEHETGNWILKQPRSDSKEEYGGIQTTHQKQKESKDGERKNEKGDRYDSGVSVDYHEHEVRNGIASMHWEDFYPRSKIVFSEEHQHGNLDDEQEMIGHKTEFSSGDVHERATRSPSESEVTPMRWYNPGITLPVSSNTSVQHRPTRGFFYEPVHDDQYQVEETERPRTPSPDYNTDDTDFIKDKHTSHKQLYATTSDTLPMHVKTNQPSNFRRLQNIRKKSVSEMQKQPQPASISVTTNGSVPNGRVQNNAVNNSQNPKESSAYDNKKAITQESNRESAVSTNSSLKKSNSELLRPPPPQSLQARTKYPEGTRGNSPNSDNHKPTQVPVSVHSVPNGRPSHPKDSTVMKESTKQHLQNGHSTPQIKTRPPVPTPRDQKSISKSSTGLNAKKEIQVQGVTNDKTTANQPRPLATHREVKNGISSTSNKKENNGNDILKKDQDNIDIDGFEKPEKQVNMAPKITLQKDDSNSSGVDSIRSYSAEIGRVLNDLDQTLETHGWQASLKKHVKQQRPLVAYV